MEGDTACLCLLTVSPKPRLAFTVKHFQFDLKLVKHSSDHLQEEVQPAVCGGHNEGSAEKGFWIAAIMTFFH